MTRIHFLLAVPAALLLLAGAARALEVTEEPDPAARTLATKISDAQRKADIQFADCIKANGGKMTERCIALRDKGARPDAAPAEAGNTAPTETGSAPAPAPGTPAN
jgi:hypothetical protein